MSVPNVYFLFFTAFFSSKKSSNKKAFKITKRWKNSSPCNHLLNDFLWKEQKKPQTLNWVPLESTKSSFFQHCVLSAFFLYYNQMFFNECWLNGNFCIFESASSRSLLRFSWSERKKSINASLFYATDFIWNMSSCILIAK